MNYTYNKFPHTPKRFCICDAKIDLIACQEKTVRFVFSKGFHLVSCDNIQLASTGSIEISNCAANDFSCHVVHRETTPFGAKLFSEPIPLHELARIVNESGRQIEIFLELYDFNCLHWRGVLLPYNMQGLSDHVVIEICGCFPMTYFWE